MNADETDRIRSSDDLARALDAEAIPWWPGDGPVVVRACRVWQSDAALEMALDERLLHLRLAVPGPRVEGTERTAMCVEACRLNGRLSLPGFQVDPDTGEVCFRASVPLGAEGIEADVLHDLMATCVATVEEHAGALVPGAGDAEDPAWEGAVVWDFLTAEVEGALDASGYRARVGERFVPSDWNRLDRERRSLLVASHPLSASSGDVEERLRALGFADAYDEVSVVRTLESGPPPTRVELAVSPADPPSLTLLAECLCDSPNRGLRGLDAEALARRLARESSGRVGAGWRVAYHDGAPVGVFHVQWAEESEAGSLGFLGLLPAHRRRGLAASLHASALRVLASIGARIYRDSTDVLNHAMRAVFSGNGCRVVGVTRHHRAPSGVEEARCE